MTPDPLRQDVEEARKAQEGASPGEEFINATDTLLAVHRALVVRELASETDAETRAKVISHMVQYHGSRHTYADCVEYSVGPILRAPLAARLAQVEAERDEWKSLANATGLRREQVEFALVAAEARVASLEAALVEYGEHFPSCYKRILKMNDCTCGFDALTYSHPTQEGK